MTRALKDPVPDRACGTCLVAICCATSPDRDAQVAAFDRAHPEGPAHARVRRLRQDHGDPAWGWMPGSGVPFPGTRSGLGATKGLVQVSQGGGEQ